MTPKEIVDAIFYTAAANNRIDGTDAWETLIGTDGPDYICGYGGYDIVKGGLGNDYIEGCHGPDDLYGGPGTDVFLFYTPEGHDWIMDWERGDYMEIMGLVESIDQVNIETVSRREHVVTLDGIPDMSIRVFGRGFDLEDIVVS